MADLKKFLDKQGVSTLWGKIAEKVAADIAAEATARDEAIAAAVKSEADRIDLVVSDIRDEIGVIPENYTEENLVDYINKVAEETLAAASGNSTETAASVKQQLDQYKESNDKALDELADRVTANEDAIELLNGDSNTAGSVDYKIAQTVAAIMENPDETMNSINELVTWINEHAESALELSNQVTTNKNDIADLADLVGSEDVATQIADAITEALKVEGVDKYALASDLAAAIVRIAANETAIAKKAEKTEVDAALALKADKTALDEVSNVANAAATKAALEEEIARAKAAEAAALADAKTYVDTQIVALTTEDIENAIASATV